MSIPQLTFTRFIAAFAVLVFHFGRDLWPFNTLGLQLPVGPYNFAVGYFFVLSGFILWVVYAPRQMELGKFWLARFARVYPLYLVAWICASATALSRGEPGAKSAFTAGLFLVQSWIPGYALALNGPAWSLSVEAFFYLMFPLILWFFRRRTFRKMVAITTGFWIVSQIWFINDHAPYFPPLHLSSFMWGCVLGRFFLERPVALRPTRFAIGALGLWAALNCVEFVRSYGHNGMLAPVMAVFVCALASNSGSLAKALSAPFLIFLGEISYGAYILQVPVHHNWFPPLKKHTDLVGTHWDFFGFVIVLLLVSAAAYRWIERPARDWLRRRAS